MAYTIAGQRPTQKLLLSSQHEKLEFITCILIYQQTTFLKLSSFIVSKHFKPSTLHAVDSSTLLFGNFILSALIILLPVTSYQ